MRTRPHRTDGSPFVLPAWLDRASDRWWGLTPRIRTALIVLAAVVVVVGGTARSLAAPFGPPTTVLVAVDDLPAGTALEAGHVRRARWPADLVPPGALTRAAGTLTAPLPAETVLTSGHVTADGLGGVAGRGRAAVPLPVEHVPAVPVGALVRVVASEVDGSGRVVADRGEVIGVDASAVWLAVADADAAAVAAAGLRGSIALVVLPP